MKNSRVSEGLKKRSAHQGIVSDDAREHTRSNTVDLSWDLTGHKESSNGRMVNKRCQPAALARDSRRLAAGSWGLGGQSLERGLGGPCRGRCLCNLLELCSFIHTRFSSGQLL